MIVKSRNPILSKIANIYYHVYKPHKWTLSSAASVKLPLEAIFTNNYSYVIFPFTPKFCMWPLH